MITVDEAWTILDRAVSALGDEEVPLSEAHGRVLAAKVVSDVDWPPFDTSAMDGYAVRAADCRDAHTGLPERPGRVAAGDPPPPPISPGEAVRLMTGAPLPEGSDAVVPVELVRRERGRVFFERSPEPDAHLRRRGESVARGTVLLPSGRRLDPAAIALAALAGKDPVLVRRRPRVAIVPTGNELVDAGESPAPGQLRDSNGPMLEALCRVRGWATVPRRRIADEPGEVEALFGPLEDADVLLTSGGVSAGDLDLLPAAAERQGWEILFHGVAVRPGKPVAFAGRSGRFWFGLPGNSVSASVGFHLFVRRALDRLEGAEAPGPQIVTARLARSLGATGPRESYRDAVLSETDGCRLVEPLSTAGSHDIAAHARANALVRLPANAPPREEGTLVSCVLLER